MATKRHSLLANQGFSLVELLVVISVISIVATLAIPGLSSITSQAHYAKNERNAQSVASVAAAARAAGATNMWSDLDAAVDDLEASIVVPSTTGDLQFSVSPVSPDERIAMAEYLFVTNGMVYYRSPTTE